MNGAVGAHELTSVDELILRLARTAAAREQDGEHIGRLAAAAGPTAVLEALQRQRLLALFGRRLLDACPAAAMPQVTAAVASVLDNSRRAGSMQELALSRILHALRDAGIRTAPLKGPSFAREVHGDVGLRMSLDLDILVEVEALQDAVRIVERLGWAPPGDVRDEQGLPLLHLALVHPQGLPPVEVHWRVHWYESRFAQDALRRGSEGQDCTQLRPEDDLAFLLLFAVRDAFAGLRLTVDAISWLERDDSGAADAVPELQRAYPALARALALAAEHVRRISGLELPHVPTDRVRSSLARSLADPLLRLSRKQALAERGLFDLLGAPTHGIAAALGRQLLPPAEELSYRARISSDVHKHARTRSGHATRTARRYAAAPLIRIRRPTRPSRLAP